MTDLPAAMPDGRQVSHGGNSQRHTIKTHLKAHPQQVTIIHLTHPLRGQTFRVLRQVADEYLIELSSAEQRFIAIDWTDQVPPPVTLPGARFLLDHLVILRQRLDAFSHPRSYWDTISPQEGQPLEGDMHGTAHTDEVSPIDCRRTNASDCHFSADGSTSTEQAGGGKNP